MTTLLCAGALQTTVNADEVNSKYQNDDSHQLHMKQSNDMQTPESVKTELNNIKNQVKDKEQEIQQKVNESLDYHQNVVVPSQQKVNDVKNTQEHQDDIENQINENESELSKLNTDSVDEQIKNVNEQINQQQKVIDDTQQEVNDKQKEFETQNQQLLNQKEQLQSSLDETNNNIHQNDEQKNNIIKKQTDLQNTQQDIESEQQKINDQIQSVTKEKEDNQKQIDDIKKQLSEYDTSNTGDVTNGNSDKLLNYMTDEWVNQYKTHGTVLIFDDDKLAKMNDDLGAIIGQRHVQYNYTASDKDKNWDITISPNVPLSHDVLLELTRFTAQILNPLRERVGSVPYEINEASLQIANKIKLEYEKDKFSIFSGKGHDHDALIRVSTEMIFKPNTDNKYNYISESYTGGFIKGMKKPLNAAGKEDWYSNKMLDYPDTRTVTMADIKTGIYNGIRIMLFADAESHWGHTTDLLGTQHPTRTPYMGTSLDALGQVHTTSVAPGNYKFDPESQFAKLSNTKYDVMETNNQQQDLSNALKTHIDKLSELNNKLKMLNDNQKDLTEKKQDVQSKLSTLTTTNIDNKLNALKQQKDKLTNELNDVQTQINNLISPELNELTNKLNDSKHKLSELQIQSQSLEKDKVYIQNQINALISENEKLKDKLNDIPNLAKYENDYSNVLTQYNQMLDDINTRNKELSDLNNKMQMLESKLKTLSIIDDVDKSYNSDDKVKQDNNQQGHDAISESKYDIENSNNTGSTIKRNTSMLNNNQHSSNLNDNNTNKTANLSNSHLKSVKSYNSQERSQSVTHNLQDKKQQNELPQMGNDSKQSETLSVLGVLSIILTGMTFNIGRKQKVK